MIVMIAVIKDEHKDIIGFRLLDTGTGKTLEATYSSVAESLNKVRCNIENLVLTRTRKVIGSNGTIGRYPVINNKLELKGKSPIIIIYKTNENKYVCSDYKGTIVTLDEEAVIKYANKNGISNGKIVGEHISAIQGSYRTKINGKYDEEIEDEIKAKVRSYTAKCALLGINDLDIRVDKEGVTLVSVGKHTEKINIPKFVTIIGSRAFKDCNKLESVELPDTLTDIEDYAFAECSNLKSINIPDSVQFIGEGAFQRCTSLERVNIPKSIKVLNKKVFSSCAMSIVDIPNGLIEIGEQAFAYCNNLLMVEMPNSVEVMGRGAFQSCRELKVVTMSNNISKIEESTFWGCGDLVSFTIPDSVTEIGRQAFNMCQYFVDVTIPKNIKSVHQTAFIGCYRLKRLKVPRHSIDMFEGNDYFQHINIIPY